MDASLLCSRTEWSWQACFENQLQELQALIVCNETKKVLLKREEYGWILPGRLYPLFEFTSAFEPFKIIPDVQRSIDSALPLTFLRQAWRRVKQVNTDKLHWDIEKSVVLMQCTKEHASEWNFSLQKHGYQWISVQKAHVFHLEEEASATILKELNYVLKEAQPENRLSWQRPGWLVSTSSWMLEQLRSKCDATLTEEVIQLRSSHLGAVLQAKTTRGNFFVKCTSALANDAAYTQTMARISPELVAAPVAVDIGKQIMITADYGEILSPADLSDVETQRLTKDYAHLQIATIGKVEDLIAAGMPDLRVPELLNHIDRLAACPIFKSLGHSERSKTDVEFFCENTEHFKSEVSKLNATELPATVTHNDLTTSNIYKPTGKENYMFFDFVEAYVSHPFVLWLWSLDEKCYLHEWSSRSPAKADELPKFLQIGAKCFLLALIILHLKEAEVAEFPEAEEEYLESARARLRRLNVFCGISVESEVLVAKHNLGKDR